ncbi:hypothetical protein TNIN_205801 [Trichonephila inaurata madagascariensis]|uniref:Ig-like domain-containing protein n=1 Tax=Trichonephila inaurata madagascariensis TaxID=2747483 RepID=A0A8X7BSW1_9ARAC|nr:hypothetical protein TNIN_205801 [Trichonephila inaurata madagascariensis]
MQWLHKRTQPCNDIPVRSESCSGFLSWCKLDPMHRKLPWHNALEKRKHEHSPRRARISKSFFYPVPPNIIDEQTSGYLTAVEGADVTLTCAARGRPEPKLSWRRTDYKLLGNGNLKSNNLAKTLSLASLLSIHLRKKTHRENTIIFFNAKKLS